MTWYSIPLPHPSDWKRGCKMDGTQTFDAEMYILSM